MAKLDQDIGKIQTKKLATKKLQQEQKKLQTLNLKLLPWNCRFYKKPQKVAGDTELVNNIQDVITEAKEAQDAISRVRPPEPIAGVENLRGTSEAAGTPSGGVGGPNIAALDRINAELEKVNNRVEAAQQRFTDLLDTGKRRTIRFCNDWAC